MGAAVFAEHSGATRKASKEFRRHQLIEATIDVLAKKGYSELTLADVAKAAGLSVGIVNFHFETKQKLLVETLKSLAEEYRTNWQEALRNSGPSAAHKLAALLAADFNEKICAPRSLTAWCAFWAEAQSRPTYQEHCSSNDAEYSAVTLDLCSSIIRQGGYSYEPRHIARALDALLEGLWIDLMTMEKPYSRQEALATVYATLNAVFPRHFTASGAVRS
jgi:TetR/AcrR family transcriptional repressor of bet genes